MQLQHPDREVKTWSRQQLIERIECGVGVTDGDVDARKVLQSRRSDHRILAWRTKIEAMPSRRYRILVTPQRRVHTPERTVHSMIVGACGPLLLENGTRLLVVLIGKSLLAQQLVRISEGERLRMPV